MSSSVGVTIPKIWEKNMFQTTNQICLVLNSELCRSRHFQIISVAMAGWPDAELAARRIFGQLGDPLAATAQLLQVVVAMRK